MGTGYVRNDTGNNIADGNVINASDLDGEFDAVQSAFNGSTGHSHDGTTGEGPQIDTAGIADDAVTAAKLDETGSYTVAGLSVTGNTTLGDAATDTVTFTADVNSNILPSADGTLALGASGSSWGDAYVTALYVGGTQVTSTAAELNILDGVTSTAAELNILDGVTSTTAELNILDGVTSTAAELNLVDGSTAGTVANSKAVIYGASGEVNATTLQVGGVSITATPAEINILDGVTSTTAELNLLDGVTATTAELNFVDGVTSNIQTQIDNINTDLVNDTTPQLGGNLDLNSSDVTGTGDINITGSVTATSFSGDGSSLTGVEAFPSGTLMLFQQTAAPTGWTKQTTHNDKALRVVSGTASSGGSSAFTTALATPSVTGTVGLTGDLAAGNLAVSMSGNISNTTLSINQIPSHSHSYNRPSGPGDSGAGPLGGNNNANNASANTGNKGGNGAHNHGHNLSGTLNGSPSTGNLAGSLSSATAAINVQYVDLIIAAKD